MLVRPSASLRPTPLLFPVSLLHQVSHLQFLMETIPLLSPNDVHCKLFAIDCRPAKRALLLRARFLKDRYLDHLSDMISEVLDSAIGLYENLQDTLHCKPKDPEELEALSTQVRLLCKRRSNPLGLPQVVWGRVKGTHD